MSSEIEESLLALEARLDAARMSGDVALFEEVLGDEFRTTNPVGALSVHLVNGMFGKSFDDMTIIPTFVLTPLTYLGGVFYSIEQLPPFWQTVSLFNPILYMVNTFRYGFHGQSDVAVGLSFGIISAFIVVFLAATLWFFKTGDGLRN